MSTIEQVILVDENDNEIGIAEKLQAHQDNLRHRAFSVFILRETPERAILLQQRAENKYHSAGLWTNTCCSHPRPDEDILLAGQRRLYEEMGIKASLKSKGWFHYIAHFENGLVENEIDHVLVGTLTNDVILPNPAEVQAYRWITPTDLQKELALHPEHFTPWFQQALLFITP